MFSFYQIYDLLEFLIQNNKKFTELNNNPVEKHIKDDKQLIMFRNNLQK